MGVDFYVVIPKLKIQIHVGRYVSEKDAEERVEQLNEAIRRNMDGKYETNLDSANYKDIKTKDLARLITFYDETAYLLDDRLISHVLIYELLRMFPGSKLVADCSNEYAKYAKYALFPTSKNK